MVATAKSLLYLFHVFLVFDLLLRRIVAAMGEFCQSVNKYEAE